MLQVAGDRPPVEGVVHMARRPRRSDFLSEAIHRKGGGVRQGHIDEGGYPARSAGPAVVGKVLPVGVAVACVGVGVNEPGQHH